MTMTVEQLIQHLQKLDPKLPVKHRDTRNPLILHDIDDVVIDEFVDLKGKSAAEALRDSRSGKEEIVVQQVVALG